MKVLTIFVALLLFTTTHGQEKRSPAGWETKPVDHWTEEDVRAILQQSAWSRSLEDVRVENLSIGTIGASVSGRFTLQSALTVRLATIRQKQLAEKYDSMSPTEKAAFNNKYRSTLECPLCEQYYIVAVAGFSEILKNAGRVQRRMESIYLANEKGEKRTLAKYSPAVTSESLALFFFPRYDEKGKPLLTADHLKVTFHFRLEPNDDALIRLIERVEVKVSDITRDGVVIF